MTTCGKGLAASLLLLSLSAQSASAVNESSFVEVAKNSFGEIPGGQSAASVFGTLQGSFPSGTTNVVGMAYDQFENGLWIADESSGSLQLITRAGAPIRSINLLAFGLTADGFADGIAVDGNRLLVTDFQGDLALNDDIIMDIDRTTGALNGNWGGTSTTTRRIRPCWHRSRALPLARPPSLRTTRGLCG